MSEENSNDYNDDDEFDRLTAEFSGEKPAKQSKPEEADEPDDQSDDLGEEHDDQQDEGDQQDEDQADADTTAEPEKEAPIDWAAKYRELEHQKKSDDGRVSAYQRQVEELKEQLKKAPKPRIESLEKAREDLPEFATAIEDALARQREELEASFNERLTPLQQAQQAHQERSEAQYLQSEIAKVRLEHPDLDNFVGGKNQEFNGWLQDQPSEIQSMSNSNEAAKAAYLIRLFKQSNASKPGASAPTERSQSNQDRLQRAVIPKTRTGSVSRDSGGDLTWDQALSHAKNFYN